MNRLFHLLTITFLFSTSSFAQTVDVDFGEIAMADLNMTEYPKDTSAAAVILYNKGYTNLDYDKGAEAFMYTYDRHLRIKILDKSGLDWADYAISLYENGRRREKITKFNAIIFNKKNGKVEETKVNKKDLLSEQVSDNYSKEKIAFPQVQEGSIIDIKYTIYSPFYYSLVDWQYQYEIPVRYSEYQVGYPNWFSYKTKFKGYDLQYITALDLQQENGSIVFNSVRSKYSSVSAAANSRLDYQVIRAGWIAKDMPAFKQEAYISTVDNFLVSVDFELASTNLPGSNWVSLTKSWEELGETMMESDDFGKQLTKGKTKFLSDEVKTVIAGVTNPQEKAAKLYNHLKRKVAWNDYQGTFITTSLKDAYKEGKGSTADINLLLLGMLRQAGLTADPVLLSTKGNGFLNQAFPSLRQFNYVIVQVQLADGKTMLLDATDKDLPMNLLPPKCINDSGLLVREKSIQWIDLKPSGKYRLTRAFDLTLNEDLEWVGTMKVRCKDYAANAMRETFIEKDNEAAYIASVESDNEGLDIQDFKVEGIQDINKSVKEDCKVTFSNQLMDGGDLLYFNPMLSFGMEENPFKLEERSYPVDYPYPQAITYSIQYKIPEGYIVDELPEQKVIALPEKSGTFNYSVKSQGGKLIVLSQFKTNKNLFLPTEYPALKEFYNIVVAKHAEQVVLKKVEN